ncbi:MAG: cytidylate kinase-like family protein [Clostridia bacterium]|nr:cytidylate kinase-like family protein [Clostridia bacterium]
MMNTIISIGRELGSGGRTIGRTVAMKFGIPYYDREIIDKTAEESGFAIDFVKSQEQKVSAYYKLCMGMSYGYGNQILSLSSQIYQAQVKVIKELAEKGPCVIVGRCADYILRDRDDLLRVFVYSDIEHRIKRAVNSYGMNEQTAKKEIQKSDKERARHYNLFTDNTWGSRENYDLMLDSGYLGLEKCADLICEVASQRS